METILEQPRANLPSKTLDQTSLHLLPCGIHHDGKANIPGFFFLVEGEYTTVKTPQSATEANLITELSETSSTMLVEKLEVASAATVKEDDASLTYSTTTTTATTTTTTVSISETSTEMKPSSVPETSFRGRTLKGAVVTVPDGYTGSIYKSFDTPVSHHGNNSAMDMEEDEEQGYEAMLRGMQEEEKTMKTLAQFKEFMIWGHDEQPTLTTDKVTRAMQWIDIAKVLHQPLC